jgi:repressor LexA
MSEQLSSKQQQILNYIRQALVDNGYPPAVREICNAVGLKSTSSVHSHLETLEKKGYIRRDKTKPRAIEILDHEQNIYTHIKNEIINIPIVGRVTAGQPILAVENIEDTFPVPAHYIRNNAEVFMLNVTGDSMIGAGIFDGDLVLVQQQQYADNGDIIVALIEDEATIKTFYREKTYIRLQPENPVYDPIISIDAKVLGKVIGLFRFL